MAVRRSSIHASVHANSRMIFKLFIAVAAALLLVPLVAMQFTEQVTWTLSDFVAMSFLLLGTGLLLALLWRKEGHRTYRLAGMAVIVLAAILFWAELSVGIFGSPIAGT